MNKKITLEEALVRIDELEKENERLRSELEEYKNRKMSGRKKHNEKWQSNLHDFAVLYENGMALIEIAENTDMSLRTIYRYRDYYEKNKDSIASNE